MRGVRLSMPENVEKQGWGSVGAADLMGVRLRHRVESASATLSGIDDAVNLVKTLGPFLISSIVRIVIILTYSIYWK